MDKFKRKLFIINILLFVLIVVVITVNVVAYSIFKLKLPDFNYGFHLGFMINLGIIVIVFIIKNFYIITDRERLKKHYFKKNDERTKMIMQKSGAVGFPLIIIGLAAAVNISLFFGNESVSNTLLITFFGIVVVMFASRIYYKIKLG